MRRALFGSLLVVASAILFWVTFFVAIDKTQRPDASPVTFVVDGERWQASLSSPPQAWIITHAKRDSVQAESGEVQALKEEPARHLVTLVEPGTYTVTADSSDGEAPIASPFTAGALEALFWMAASLMVSVLLGLIGLVLVANGLGLNRPGVGQPRKGDLLSGLTLWLGLSFIGPMIGAWRRRHDSDADAWVISTNFHLSIGLYLVTALLMTTFAIGFLLIPLILLFHLAVIGLRLGKPGPLPLSQIILGRPPREKKGR